MPRASFNCRHFEGELYYNDPVGPVCSKEMNTIWVSANGATAGVDLSTDDALALALDILIMLKDSLTPEMADGIRSELPMAEAEEEVESNQFAGSLWEHIHDGIAHTFKRTRSGALTFYRLDNDAAMGGAYMGEYVFERFAKAVAEEAGLELAVPDEEAPEPKPVNPNPKFSNLNPQASLVYQHMARAGSISARDAFDDHGITSATLSRRICDIEAEGFKVERESKKHPITERRYTRYSLKDQPPLALPHYPE